MPVPVAEPSNAWFFGQSLVGIEVQNPAVGMDVSPL
jgi:hypothetical protein